MNIKDIPLIIASYNQITYLKNSVNWFRWYYPENEIIVIDNNSDARTLWHYLHDNYPANQDRITVIPCSQNDMILNVTGFLEANNQFSYYILSDPDIMPHPATPPNFLEIFKHAIDYCGFHHAGFDLITEDIPDWNKKKAWIQGDEKALHGVPVEIEYEGQKYEGWKAAIDSTFCLYRRDNGGWYSPMSGEHWGNSLRLFKAFHLPFYLHPDKLNHEMQHYYATCLRHDVTKPATGRAHFIPEK